MIYIYILYYDRRRWCAITALGSRAMEGHINSIMVDDRLANRPDSVKETLHDEVQYVENLSVETWSLLQMAVEDTTSMAALVLDTLTTLWISVAYLWRLTVLPLFNLPWILARGDISQQLVYLQNADRPTDECSGKIWDCLQAGEFFEVVAAVGLLRLIGWTILMSEQGHGSMSAVRRFHHSLGAPMCMARSLIHLLWPVIQVDRRDRRQERLEERLKRLKQKKPERSSAQGAFLSDAVSCALAQVPNADGPMRRSITRQVVGDHHREYEILTPGMKRIYEDQNKESVETKRENLDQDIAHAEA